MASPTSFFGGLDIETIVRALIDAQRGPVLRAQNVISESQAKLKAYDDISSALSSLESKRSSLLKRESLTAQVATSSEERLLTATATGRATSATPASTDGWATSTGTNPSIPTT